MKLQAVQIQPLTTSTQMLLMMMEVVIIWKIPRAQKICVGMAQQEIPAIALALLKLTTLIQLQIKIRKSKQIIFGLF
jgi:hypothetical protein